MVERNYGPIFSHDDKVRRHLQVLYARKTRERQIFMGELRGYRHRKFKQMLGSIVKSVGPRWYQALSVPQRSALDILEASIYQDLLEGRPHRSASVMKALGLYPRPTYSELMNCIYVGRDDPKEMLAHLYLSTYGYPIEGKRTSYCLNARLMLSAILYLGLDDLLHLLKKRFAPDASIAASVRPPRIKPEPPLPSPYLQKMVAVLYEPRKHHRAPPPPLPDLSDLNEPYEEERVMPRPPPPPPPPPPPKKRLPRSYCDDLANIMPLMPHQSVTNVSIRKATRTSRKSRAGSKLSVSENAPKKKIYGIGSHTAKKVKRRKKPVAPSTGLGNAQYTINGVYQVHGKTVFVVGNISILPAQGELIHGGNALVRGEYINIHLGYRGWPPEKKLKPCDCVKQWHVTVFEHLTKTKCYCGHYFDYGNEGSIPPDELPYFLKPTAHCPLHFNYHTIFDLDEHSLHVEKEFKRLWETDSALHSDDGTNKTKDDKKKKKKKPGKSIKSDDNLEKVSDETTCKVKYDDKKKEACLGAKPKVEDYLKCALRFMRRVNIAARLPDLHLVPELKEWMRRRLYGSRSDVAKKEYLRKSTTYWQMFSTLAQKGFAHVWPPKEPMFSGHTDWVQKHSLNKKFQQYVRKYKLSIFRSQAYVTNLLWRTMYQAEFPDKKFREIYFSYLYSQLEDLQLIHPYNTTETEFRKCVISKKRYICLPAGWEEKT